MQRRSLRRYSLETLDSDALVANLTANAAAADFMHVADADAQSGATYTYDARLSGAAVLAHRDRVAAEHRRAPQRRRRSSRDGAVVLDGVHMLDAASDGRLSSFGRGDVYADDDGGGGTSNNDDGGGDDDDDDDASFDASFDEIGSATHADLRYRSTDSTAMLTRDSHRVLTHKPVGTLRHTSSSGVSPHGVPDSPYVTDRRRSAQRQPPTALGQITQQHQHQHLQLDPQHQQPSQQHQQQQAQQAQLQPASPPTPSAGQPAPAQRMPRDYLFVLVITAAMVTPFAFSSLVGTATTLTLRGSILVLLVSLVRFLCTLISALLAHVHRSAADASARTAFWIAVSSCMFTAMQLVLLIGERVGLLLPATLSDLPLLMCVDTVARSVISLSSVVTTRMPELEHRVHPALAFPVAATLLVLFRQVVGEVSVLYTLAMSIVFVSLALQMSARQRSTFSSTIVVTHVPLFFANVLLLRSDKVFDQAFMTAAYLLMLATFALMTKLAMFFGQRLRVRELEKKRLEFLSRRQQVEEENMKLQELVIKSLEVNNMKKEFLSNMSNEIRAPMNGVMGVLSLLLQTSMTPNQLVHVQGMQHSANLLLGIINDILDFTKMESGTISVDCTPFNLRTAIEDVAELTSVKAFEKQLELIVDFQSTCGVFLIGDERRIRQVLTHLVVNAIKFTLSGQVVVEVRVSRADVHDALAVFKVRDTGIGIPADKYEAIFEKFTQGDASTRRCFGGTGIGLAICKQLAQLMGGDVRVHSRVGKGSEFTFSLRLPIDPHAPTTEPEASGALPRAQVIVLDDNASSCDVLYRLLDSWNLQVTTYTSPHSALADLSGYGPACSVVVVDLHMADMSGIDFARRLQAEERDVMPAVVLLAPHSDITFLQRSGDANLFAAWACKPIRQGALFRALAHAVDAASRMARAGAFMASIPHTAGLADVDTASASPSPSTTLHSVTGVGTGVSTASVSTATAIGASASVSAADAAPAAAAAAAAAALVDAAASETSLLDEMRVAPNQSDMSAPLSAATLRDADGARLVLLVEDNHLNRKVALGVLRYIGIDADFACDGAEAVSMATANRYRLILMDLQLPVMNGYEAAKAIRMHEAEAHVPRAGIVATSSVQSHSDRELCYAVGMDDIIAKPILSDQVRAVIAKFVHGPPDVSHIELLSLDRFASVCALGLHEQPEQSPSLADDSAAAAAAGAATSGAAGQRQSPRSLLGMFDTEGVENMRRILSATQVHSLDALRRAAHALRGSSSTIGLERLAAVCALVERAALTDDVERVRPLIEELPRLFDASVQLARESLQSMLMATD